MKKSKVFLSLIIATAAVTAAVNIFNDTNTIVTVSTVSSQSYAPYLVLSGNLESSNYVMHSQNSAVVSKVYVKKGDDIKKGEPICSIDKEATAALVNISGQESSFQTEILAQQTGKISEVNVKSGSVLSEGDEILSYNGKGGMQITVLVSESKIGKISIGQRAEITGNGFENNCYDAYVCSIGETAKKISLGGNKIVVVDVVLKINNPDDTLKEGFTAKVKLFTDTERDVCVVPYTAVLQDDNGEYVYIYNKGKAVRANIRTGQELLEGYEVLEGICEGNIVITSPLNIKKDKSNVSIISEET